MNDITYDQIAEVNKKLKKTNISGKNYVEVKERIKGFRMIVPDGFIRTKVELIDEDTCIATAEVGQSYPDGDRIYATGTAMESKTASRINAVSFIENAETSAVGRALGMLGIGIEAAVASAEEMTKADKASDRQKGAILNIYGASDGGLMDLMEALGVSEIDNMSYEQASAVISLSKARNWQPLTRQDLDTLRRRRK